MPISKFCAYCGAAAHKATDRIYNPISAGTIADRETHANERASWTYDGALIVVRRDYTDPAAWGSKDPKFLHYVDVWDSEAWVLNRGLFCTMTCAELFANAAHEAGYRVTKKP